MTPLEVFIAEDEPPIADMIADMVRKAPGCFRVGRVAHDGQTMLDHLNSFCPDVLLADIRMPVLDGLQLLAQARQRYPELICVMLTSYSEFDFARTALHHGAFDYVLKTSLPDSLYEVLYRVRELLGPGEDEAEDNSARMEIAGRLKDYLDHHVKGNFNLKIIAEQWGYNPLYLSRAFKARFALSPKRYHTRAKITLITDAMAKDPDLLLKEAAALVHFEDELYLSKVFKKETGVCFSDFRRGLEE